MAQKKGAPPMAGDTAQTTESTSTMAAVELATAAAAAAAADNAAPAPKHRMPMDHVRWILAQKPMAPPPLYAALKRGNPELTPRPGEELDEDARQLYVVAKAFYEMEERLPREQERVREEMRTKGYVEVTEEWVRNRAACAAMDVVDREWPDIQAKIDAMVREDKDYAAQRRRERKSRCR